MTSTEQDKLREAILLEFKNVHRLAPADYTENCTNVVMQLITQYGDTREREGQEWNKINVSDGSTYPPLDTPVLARMTYDNKKFDPIYIVVKHVDEDDCDWRTSDGDELSYWVNVTHWQAIAELKGEI